jgi:hypothetical protein
VPGWRATLPPKASNPTRRQATRLVPLRGFTVAGQRRVHTGLRWTPSPRSMDRCRECRPLPRPAAVAPTATGGYPSRVPRPLRIALIALLAAAGIAAARRWKPEAAPRARGSWTPL